MRIAVLGSTGKLGSALVERLRKDKHQLGLIAGRNDLDVTNLTSLAAWLGTFKPSIIINATAMIGMETCERDPVQALMINAVVPGRLAELAVNFDALLIHYSSDYVLRHDGNDTLIKGWRHGMLETQRTSPWGMYGTSKHAGELAVEAVNGYSIIMRLSSIYGDEPSGVTEAILQHKRGKGTIENPIEVLHQFTAPTSVRLIADATAHIVASVPCGFWGDVSSIYHFATRGGMYKRDFARMILGEGPTIVEGQLTEPRPTISYMNSDLFAETFDYDIPTTEEDWRLTMGENNGR